MTWSDVARAQAGVVTMAQLLAADVPRHRAQVLVRQGALERVQRGVFRLPGADEAWPQPLWVALLAAGPEAFAWGRAAGALWGLDGLRPGIVDVAVGRGHHPRLSGVVRLNHVGPEDVTSRHGIRLTSVGRTLGDLGRVVEDTVVERSLESALRSRLLSEREVLTEADRPRRGGLACLRRVMAARPAGIAPTDSDAETLFVQIARGAGLPAPARQHTVILRGTKYRIDFAWPLLRLAVEIDGAAAHGPGQLGADLRRQNRILLDGWLVIRFTWQMVAHDPDAVARDLVAAWEVRSVSTRLGA